VPLELPANGRPEARGDVRPYKRLNHSQEITPFLNYHDATHGSGRHFRYSIT
jgi:hypothetical protein